MAALLLGFGFFGLLAQIILLRELAVVFHGHELSFSLALASWLLWTGMGSFSQRGAAAGSPPAVPEAPIPPSGAEADARRCGRKIAFLSLAAPLTILLVRWSKGITPPGVLPGLFESLALPLILLAPVSWLSGASFGALSRLGTASPARLYFWESAGALAAGLTATFALIGRAPALPSLCVAGAVLALLNLRLARPWETLSVAVLCAGLALSSGRVDKLSRSPGWRGFDLIEQKEGRYGHLAMAETSKLKVLFQNGIASLHFPDPSSEETVHWPLLAHPKPRKVLALGVGALPAAAEFLKHPITSLQILTPDREAVDMVKRRLEPSGQKALDDPRVKVLIVDPREYLKGRHDSYDLILVFAGEPANAAANRLYTREFHAEALGALADKGILAFTLPSAENYLAPEVAYANASVFNSLKEVFPHTSLIPGSRMTVLAGKEKLALDTGQLLPRYRRRKLKTETLVPEAFPYLLMPGRRDMVLQRIQEAGEVAPNTDLRPTAYFHTWRVWLLKFVSPAHLLGLIAAAALALWGVSRLWVKRKTVLGSWPNTAVLAMGFAGIVLEIVLLLVFQAVSGALYWRLGLLLAAMMAGLALGSLLGVVKPLRGRAAALTLRVLLLGMIGLLALLARQSARLAGLDAAGALWVFSGLLALDGFLVGWSYPLAAGRTPAQTYAADLWGSSLGAFATSAFLVPLAGIRTSLLVCAVLVLPAALWPARGVSR